ncbi:MAG: T9SS type A sorting domain-containing protein, partial [Ignavibacteriaceae bacterium]|nr:T9SS type A sorting domain-containing protein [Ignavibacteriaceae bacterium]
ANAFPEADELKIYISADSKIYPSEVLLRSMAKTISLTPIRDYLQNYNGSVYSITINVKDSSFSNGSFFQILSTFKNDAEENSTLKFYGIYKKNGKPVGYLTNPNPGTELEEKFIKVNLKFYKPQKNAGRAIQFEKNSSFSFLLNKFPDENLLAEFWLRTSDSGQDILSVKNIETDQREFLLTLNDFQMLYTRIENASLLFSAPYFLGRKTWSHISILFSAEKNSVSLFCSGNLFAKIKLTSLLSVGKYEFAFSSEYGNKNYSIDLLRFINLKNTIDVSFSNKNFNNFNSDSSTVIAAFKFDDQLPQTIEKENYSVKVENLQYIKSNAPIFARAPELNIDILTNAYELIWSGGDYKQADSYTLEKSMNNSGFQSLYKVHADNSTPADYSFIDAKELEAEIVYYRVKQINLDGSVVFSAQLKVGQGESEPLVLAQNFPNPFNPKTNIELELLEDSEVDITIYNLEGQEIVKLFKGQLAKGVHKFTFDGSGLPSGIYLYKVSTPSFNTTRKMVLTK